MRRGKQYIFLFCLILAGSLLGLMAAEVAVRVLAPHSRDHVIPTGFFQIDDDLGWKLAAGKSVNHRSRYFDTTYTTNSLGFRDKERQLVKGENIHRILLYGDSRVFGWGVDREKRFSNLSEAGRPSLEIWNLGVPGYGLGQEIISYEKNGSSLNADEIILFVSRATLDRTRYDYQYKKHKPKFVLDDDGELTIKPVPKQSYTRTRLLYRVLSPLYLPYFLELRLKILKETLRKSDPAADDGAGPILGEIQKAMLLRAKKAAVENSHRLTVLASHSRMKIEGLQEFCEEAGIGYIEIDSGGEEPENLVFGKRDLHWNPRANELIARQLVADHHIGRAFRSEQAPGIPDG